MSNARRGAAIYTLAAIIVQAAMLLRTLFVARQLSLEDFGIAATYLLIITLIDMIAQMRPDLLLVQDRGGDDADMQAGLQAYQAVRGLIAALILVAIAWPLAWSFGQQDRVGNYMLLAIVPLLGGLMHFDQHRLKREMNFTPAAAVLCLPYAGSLALAVALAPVIRDDRLMLYAIIGQQVIALALSHLMAQRRYRWRWEWALVRRVTTFGLPMLLNGILLFLIMNGERWIVGNQLGMADLAIFTLMLNLSLTPALVFTNLLQTWFLPQLSRLQDEPRRFAAFAQVAQEAYLSGAVAFAAAAALLGPPLAALVAGSQYRDGVGIFVWLALVQAVRMAKAGSNIVTIAKARTGNSLAGNLLRVASLPIGMWWLASGGTMIGLVVIALAAECGGFIIALWLARRSIGLALRPLVLPSLAAAATIALIAADTHFHPPSPDPRVHAHAFQLAYLAAAAGTIMIMRAFLRLLMGRAAAT